ncbi:hypothetical protein ILUMI_01502 [Ignelater luminosus]|uniref:Uncharacterized protein n=1 Tax=Ignelater luminosus TaxID=2038154 RepID=A0A8K0DEH0_IGNLU|nr:hypothetical protein ILUMI_01502 [Ignelater luminosus]
MATVTKIIKHVNNSEAGPSIKPSATIENPFVEDCCANIVENSSTVKNNKRNPDVVLRTPEATSLMRATGFNKPQVDRFYDRLIKLAPQMYNADETGLSTVHKNDKIFSGWETQLQPLDRMCQNPSARLTDYDVAGLADIAFTKAAQNGFRCMGIQPFNRDVFSDLDFLGSALLDIPAECRSHQSTIQVPSPAVVPENEPDHQLALYL